MSPQEYFDRCLLVKYDLEAPLTEFGKPMNCYGFVFYFYKLCLGIELDKGNVRCFDNIRNICYTRVDTPQDGDVVDLKSTMGSNVPHVGIVYKDVVFHFTHDGLRMKNRFRMASWIKGYYRVNADKN